MLSESGGYDFEITAMSNVTVAAWKLVSLWQKLMFALYASAADQNRTSSESFPMKEREGGIRQFKLGLDSFSSFLTAPRAWSCSWHLQQQCGACRTEINVTQCNTVVDSFLLSELCSTEEQGKGHTDTSQKKLLLSLIFLWALPVQKI